MDINKMLIVKEHTVLDAMRRIDANSGTTLIVVGPDNKMFGTISDGDIRRWIMSGGSIESPVEMAANKTPKTVYQNNVESAFELLNKYKIDVLPVLDKDGRVVDIMVTQKTSSVIDHDSLNNIPIVIMAGGLGTRLYPYTKILPKPLIPIGDVPITEHIINRFREYGCRKFYFIVNHKKNMIKAYYNEIEKDYVIHFIDEDEPLGTGGGVGLLRGLINSTFILTNCDTLIDDDYSKMVDEHRKKKNSVTMICSLKNFDIAYGVVEIGKNGTITTMKEKPHYSFFTNTGTYIVEPEVIDEIKPHEKIGFPDIVQRMKDKGHNVGAFPIGESAWLDMGQFDSMEEMRKKLNV